MPRLKIEGVPAYDGEYEIDLNFTNRELHTIKQMSGVRPGEIMEAMGAGDTDVVVALAVNALRRAGKVVNVDALWDAEAGLISFMDDEEPADAVPPHQPSDQPVIKPLEQSDSSGASGNGSGESPPESDPSRIGLPDSGIGVTSGPRTLAS